MDGKGDSVGNSVGEVDGKILVGSSDGEGDGKAVSVGNSVGLMLVSFEGEGDGKVVSVGLAVGLAVGFEATTTIDRPNASIVAPRPIACSLFPSLIVAKVLANASNNAKGNVFTMKESRSRTYLPCFEILSIHGYNPPALESH